VRAHDVGLLDALRVREERAGEARAQRVRGERRALDAEHGARGAGQRPEQGERVRVCGAGGERARGLRREQGTVVEHALGHERVQVRGGVGHRARSG
jgi:hypothetical protein